MTEQYDRVRAVFHPKRQDDLQNNSADYIGREGVFMAAWVIEDGPYAGQWAMQTPLDWGPAWVPECDLRVTT